MHYGSDYTLGLVDFTVRPHLNSTSFERASLASMERAAQQAGVPLYAIDDQSAIRVDGSKVDVVSEGQWRIFEA